jgi:predicted PolB exonuclease-like 3'-5' exonuclease
MVDIIFDLETAPTGEGEPWLTKDEATGEEKDISAMSPITGRITAAGWITEGKPHVFIDKDERKIIDQFWRTMEAEAVRQHGLNFIRLVGFNIKDFDIHFILVRSLHHNVKIAKFNGRQTIDLREHLANFKTYMRKGSLNDYARLIKIDGKYKDIKGEEVPLLWKEGKLEDLENYLKQDLLMTEALYLKCKELGILGDYA